MTKEYIEKALSDAVGLKTGLSDEILGVRGFSTPTIRHLFHALCNSDKPITYLEIGLFCGASFCASFNENCTSIGIEDHSQDFSEGFDQVKKELKENVEKFSSKGREVKVHYADCFAMDKSVLPNNIDIYSFDGFHSFETQAKALPHFLDKMADNFIFLVDDANWDYVAAGTIKGFEEIKSQVTIEAMWELKGELANNDPVWHNGVLICLVNKK